MEHNHSNRLAETSERSVTCPSCGAASTSSRIEEEKFQYGEGPTAETLAARVTVYECSSCADEFLDGDADDARHEAVCRHLGVFTPEQIRTLRARYDLSRAEFSRVTKLGEATLARWERGSLIQNSAHDRFLYLLSFPENLNRLRALERPQLHVLAGIGPRVEPTFRCLQPTVEDRKRAKGFRLTEAA